jgi:hypothetical protein
VEEDPCRAQVRKLLRLLDERAGLSGRARAVDETGVELALRLGDRLAGLAKVRDVVERVVETEDADPVFCRRHHEPPDEIDADRL